MASSTASLTKFSEAMSSRPSCWRRTSLSLAAKCSCRFSADGGGADAGDFVGGDRHADSAAADEDAEIGVVTRNLFADGASEVGIVHGRGRSGAAIVDSMSLLRQMLHDLLLQFEAGMVGAESDLHEAILAREMGCPIRRFGR